MTTQERIKADAEKAASLQAWTDRLQHPVQAKRCDDIYAAGYEAGATAEHAHMQPVIDTAEKVAKIFAHDGEHQTCAICQLAKALEQWKSGKGKEVGDE